MFEHQKKPLITKSAYHRRLIGAAGLALLLITASLGVGILGYHWLEDMPWIDAYLSASMILSGMGVLAAPVSVEGKLFAGLYAIFCGLVLIAATAIMFTPVIHRFLHQMHMDDEDDA